MDKCPICKDKEATKKNAHLIPWFLIKKCVTQDGSGDRDMELSFSIDPDSFTKMYTGRGILPENLEEYSKLDDQLKVKKNPYSRDNLFCPDCEDKLSRLEAIFASKFSDKNLNIDTQPNFKSLDNHSKLIASNYDYSLYELLIQSIFYRCSIGRFNEFRLESTVEKKIAENLRAAFSLENFNKIKPATHIEILNKFPMITCSLFVPEGEDPTSKFIVLNQSRFPYCLIAGKWMFQLFEAEKHLKSSVEWLYGLHDKLNTTKTYNLVKENSHVIVIERNASEAISQNFIEFFAEKRIIGLKKKIKIFHLHVFKQKPNEYIVHYILQQYLGHLNEGKTELKSMINAFQDLKKLP